MHGLRDVESCISPAMTSPQLPPQTVTVILIVIVIVIVIVIEPRPEQLEACASGAI